MQLRNSLAFIDLYLACTRIGVIFVPVNVLYKDREVSHILHDSEPRLFVTDPSELEAAAASQPDTRPAVTLDGDTPAGIIYTSGTTGTSKGAVLTHNNFLANAHESADLLADHFLRPPASRAASVSHPRTGQRTPLLARVGMPHASARTIRPSPRPRPNSSISVPRCSSASRPSMYACSSSRRRSHPTCACSSPDPRRSRRTSWRVPQPLRTHDSRTLRHDRDIHEHVESLCRRAAAR